MNHVFIQICAVAAGEGAPVPLFPFLPQEEICGLTASSWVFAHQGLDGGFVVKYYLISIHKDVETASDVAGEYENGISDKNRDGDLKFSFNVWETFGLSGKDNA